VNLLSFIRETIHDVATETGFDPEIDDSKVVEIFVDGLEQLLNNPRKAIRFGNALRFTYPIVKGEVNTMDLLIVEAFKASLPAYYAFMRENKDIFLQDYLDERVNEYIDVTNTASRAINVVIKSYPEKVSRALRQLTCKLFPEFFWNDPAEAKIEKKDSLIIKKRICIIINQLQRKNIESVSHRFF
jgi:predicted KAP-like P-loop ATPase